MAQKRSSRRGDELEFLFSYLYILEVLLQSPIHFPCLFVGISMVASPHAYISKFTVRLSAYHNFINANMSRLKYQRISHSYISRVRFVSEPAQLGMSCHLSNSFKTSSLGRQSKYPKRRIKSLFRE